MRGSGGSLVRTCAPLYIKGCRASGNQKRQKSGERHGSRFAKADDCHQERLWSDLGQCQKHRDRLTTTCTERTILPRDMIVVTERKQA